MKQLQFRLIMLVLGLALFFSFERIGVPTGGLIGPGMAIYGLVTVAILATLAAAFLPGHGLMVNTLLWVVVYLVARFFVLDRYPFFGGIYSYVIWTEMTFVAYLLTIAYLVARGLAEFRDGVAYITFHQAGGYLPSVEEEAETVDAELMRSRRSGRPLGLIAVEADSGAFNAQIDPMVASVQKALGRRYARLRLADELRQVLRPIDLLLEAEADGTLLLLCPEADQTDCSAVAERVRMVLDGKGVTARYAVATFPEEGVTFDALVDSVRGKLEKEAVAVAGVRRQAVGG